MARKCVACTLEIPSGAKRCPHCTEVQPSSVTRGLIAILAVMVGTMTFVCCMGSVISENKRLDARRGWHVYEGLDGKPHARVWESSYKEADLSPALIVDCDSTVKVFGGRVFTFVGQENKRFWPVNRQLEDIRKHSKTVVVTRTHQDDLESLSFHGKGAADALDDLSKRCEAP